MRSRTLTEVFVLQRRSESLDSYGQPVETWTDLETFRGSIENGYSREFNRYNLQESRTDAVIRTRRLDTVPTPMDRVRTEKSARIYNIISVPLQGGNSDETVIGVQEQPYHSP